MNGLVVDRQSLLVEVAAELALAEVEAALLREDYTLCLDGAPSATVGAWLAGGAHGARSPWEDPADHLVAGFRATQTGSGELLDVRAAPRKSVGPDLLALVVGMNERFFVLTHVTLRIFPRGVPAVRAPFAAPVEAPPSRDEDALLDRIAAELHRP